MFRRLVTASSLVIAVLCVALLAPALCAQGTLTRHDRAVSYFTSGSLIWRAPAPAAFWPVARMAVPRLSATRSLGFRPFVRPLAITNDTWQGNGPGNWSAAASWSLGTSPGAGNNAIINNSSPASVVQYDVSSDTINNLTIGSTSALNINNGNILTIDGTTITNSDKTGTGGLTLGSTTTYAELVIGGNVTLTGGGTVTLSNSPYNLVYGAAGTDVLTNANNLIQGAGQLGFGQMGLVNQGTIDANQSTPLLIQTSSGVTNTGTLEATAGANLILSGDTYTNAGGTILASGSGSIVTLEGNTINGGTLSTAGGGLIQASGNPTLNSVTNNGAYQIPNAMSTTIGGTFTNNGSVQLQSTGNYVELIASGAVTLTGGGTVTMSDSNFNLIFGSTSLTNVNNTISGSGNIGNGSMAFTNQASGVVDAVSASGNILTISPGSGGVTNLGLMEASSGGTLSLQGAYTNSNGATSGTIEALNGGSVVLNGATIAGGKLITAGTGTMIAENATLDGSTNAITTSSNLQVPNAFNLSIAGTINNNGPLSLNSTNSYTQLLVNSAATTLQGTGSITLSDSDYNLIQANTSGNQLTIAQPITGPGGNIGNGDLVVVNQTTIDATKSASGNILTIQPDGTFTNNGLLEATGGGMLTLYGGTFANAGHTITAGSGSTVNLSGGVTVTGGTLNGGGTFVANSATELDGSANTLNLASTLQVPNSDNLYIKGAINNTGAIQLNSTNSYTQLLIDSPTVTLQGSGSIMLSDSNYNLIQANSSGNQLTIAQPITGPGGNIGNGDLVVTNQSTINATASASGNVLTIQPDGTFTNNGLLETTGGGSMALSGGTFANAGGTITAGSGSTIALQGGVTIAGGTMNGAGTYLANSGTTLDGSTNTLNLASTLQVPDSFNLYVKGTINNTGSIQLNSSSTYTFLSINGNTTLNGNGTVVLSNSPYNYIEGVAGTEVLTSSNTIEGSGNIGNTVLGFVNKGTVLANNTTPLYIKPNSSGFTNNGTVQVNTGSLLDITAGPFNNFNSTTSTLTGGTYNVNGGTLQFDNANIITNAANIILTGAASKIVNGTGVNALTHFAVNTAAGSFTLGPGRNFTTAGNFTNNGTLTVGSGDTFRVSGSLTNFASNTLTRGTYNIAGTLQFGATGSSLTTNAANLTLNGLNAKLLDQSGNNLLANFNTNSTGALFRVGAGGSFTTAGAFTNSGTMDLEQASALTVSGNLTNSGTVATNSLNLGGGANTLTVTGTLTNNTGDTVTVGANNDTTDTANVGQLANSGTVTVDTGAKMNLTGTGADTNSGAITVSGGTLAMQAGSFTNSGTLDLEKKSAFTVSGNLTNSGTLTTNNGNLRGGANTITVTGTLTNNTGANMTVGVNGDNADVASVGLLSNGGNVTVDKFATLKLTATGADSNTGAISLNGGSMTVASGGALTNSGTLDAEQGGKLTITGGLTNAGTLSTNDSNLGGTANSISISGKLTNNTNATVTIGANNDTTDSASVGYFTNSGAMTVGTGASLALSTATTDTNTGTIAINGTLDVKAASTLSGAGSLTLTNGAMAGVGSGITFTNKSTIQGSGTLSNLGIANTGLLFANQAAPLVILPTSAGLNNTGTLEVAAGDMMQIGTSAGGALTNFLGTTLTGGSYNLSGTLQFGASGTTIATNAANITLNGAGQMLDFGNNKILAGLTNNAATGSFKLNSGASFTTAGGSFTNAGLFTVSALTIFTVGGSSFNFTQTGGTAKVDGTLTSTSLGTLAVNGGTLDGVGTLGYNVVDSSILTPGDSATVTGKLSVADTYTQNSTGALDIQINGATAGAKYDQLKVTQAASLGGTLNIALGTGFTPTVGETFTILTASSLNSTTFATVNGLAINGSEHFVISYQAGSVVLTVASGALTASSPILTAIASPALRRPAMGHGFGHFGVAVAAPRMMRVPALAPVFSQARRELVVTPSPAAFAGAALHGFHRMDVAGSAAVAPVPSATGDAGFAGSMGLAPVSATAYNAMSAMNHARFECGVDLKALMKTSRKQLLRGLWASPDSKDALAIGYMTYIGKH